MEDRKVIDISYPDKHDNRNEHTRSPLLEQDVGKRLKDRVRDKKERERRIVLRTGHIKILCEAEYLCISNIGSIEEAEEASERFLDICAVRPLARVPDKIQ